MIETRVVRNEIEQQPQATPAQAFAQSGQSRITTQNLMYGIASDGETGPGNVLLLQIR
jgi:hypothetical protein